MVAGTALRFWEEKTHLSIEFSVTFVLHHTRYMRTLPSPFPTALAFSEDGCSVGTREDLPCLNGSEPYSLVSEKRLAVFGWIRDWQYPT